MNTLGSPFYLPSDYAIDASFYAWRTPREALRKIRVRIESLLLFYRALPYGSIKGNVKKKIPLGGSRAGSRLAFSPCRDLTRGVVA